METTNTQRTNVAADADRLLADQSQRSQEHSARMRELRQKQSAELQSLDDLHQRNMKQAESAYRVEFSAKSSEHARKLKELEERQQGQLATQSKSNDQSLKQIQETYRAQAEALRNQGERKLATIRDEQSETEQNITRRVKS